MKLKDLIPVLYINQHVHIYDESGYAPDYMGKAENIPNKYFERDVELVRSNGVILDIVLVEIV